MNDNPEKRLCVRYDMKNVSEVNLSIPTLFGLGKKKNVKLGLIHDISMGGMAIQYEGSDAAALKATHLSIVVPGKGTLIDAIPFEIVEDRKLDPSAGKNSPRRCGLKFGELTEEQRNRLRFIVNNYSTKKNKAE